MEDSTIAFLILSYWMIFLCFFWFVFRPIRDTWKGWIKDALLSLIWPLTPIIYLVMLLYFWIDERKSNKPSI